MNLNEYQLIYMQEKINPKLYPNTYPYPNPNPNPKEVETKTNTLWKIGCMYEHFVSEHLSYHIERRVRALQRSQAKLAKPHQVLQVERDAIPSGRVRRLTIYARHDRCFSDSAKLILF